jgi:hypothetical protein
VPKFLESKLRREYSAKGKSGQSLNHAIYGTLNSIGAMKGPVETAKGRAMQKKHNKKVKLVKLTRLMG